jgi:hypothetical protein
MKWRSKSPCAEISESSKQQENSTNVSSVIIGTQELKLKEPVVVDEPANSKKVILNIPPRSSANDHEASTSKAKPRDPKYTQPKWCPLGLTKTQKRRLQRMRNQEKVEHTAEKRRDEFFDKTHPVPYKKWVLKKVEGAAVPMTIAKTATSSEEKDVNIDELTTPLPTTPDSVPISEDDEELVDFENSPAREGMDMNMVYYLPSEFRAVDEEGEVAQLDFGPKNAIFEKPKEPVKHLKPLYVKGHINGSPVARMLVDGGAVVNLMPYSVFKKLGLDENDLMKTNMVLNGFEGKEKTEAKGVMSVELTVGSKSLATAFFIAEVQGNYNVIIGRDWLHANQCVSSTLHQFLIQWVDDEVEVVYADNSTCIALADSPVDWQHPNATCLTGRDLSDFDFLSATKNGFVPVSLKPIYNNRLPNM